MRRLFVVLLFAFAALSSALAQSQPKDAESVYVRSFPIVKIYSHQLGYKIYYLTPKGEVGVFYAPIEWFSGVGARGSITYGVGPQYPYCSVYWIDRKFSHLKLFLIENPLDATWGALKESPSEIAGEFKVDEPKLVLE